MTRHAPGGPVVLVVAPARQSGKSTVAALFSERLGVDWIPSSRPVVERVERRLHLRRGTIDQDRADSPERYRAELVAEGDRMTAEGISPGVLCVRSGYRIVDGIRRQAELRDSITAARAMGRTPLVVLVERPGASVGGDNTEADGLRALADVRILNDGSLVDLARAVDDVCLARGLARLSNDGGTDFRVGPV